jgi:flagellar motor switch protein FliN/FliY
MPDTSPQAQSAASEWAAAMAEQQAASGSATPGAAGVVSRDGKPALFEQFSKSGAGAAGHNDIDLILDIPVQLTVELGRTKIAIKNLLQLAQGSVVELDGLAGEPMDVLVNGCLIAQGEVVVVNDKFGIRLTDIITPSERIRKLNR